METRFIATLLIASFLFLIVSAQPAPPAPSADRTVMLDSALTDMKCKVTFETGFMNAMISLFPSTSSSLSPIIQNLQSDVTKLSGYASQRDVMNYSIYVQESFTPHLMSAAEAERKAMEGMKDAGTDKNATKASMRSLKSTFESLSDAQNVCFDAKEHAKLMINYYTNSINTYESRAKNMSDRGIGASYLHNLVAHARQEILTPLQNEIDSATTSSQVRDALSKYCLFDGCLNGTNFHMATKFETTRLTILLEILSSDAAQIDADKNGIFDRDEIKIYLEHANDMIDSWGNMNADGGQLKANWDNIRSAAKMLHQIYVELGGSTREE